MSSCSWNLHFLFLNRKGIFGNPEDYYLLGYNDVYSVVRVLLATCFHVGFLYGLFDAKNGV
jgi:hypothetical protein